ncbi:hypothetical protein BaRGS_00035657 [Batillaria attramentaria]|uniref:Uncharacterized protein n=1 Tax=Batillaria attramentaria TaxID=370345 RepID=A0ABD0JE56_9CAEN
MANVKSLPTGVLLIFLSSLRGTAEGGSSGSPPVTSPFPDLEKFTPDKVKDMFNAMKEYGEEKLKQRNENEKKRAKQFILVLALSEGEILDSGAWSSDRVREFEGDDTKSAFLVNTADHDIDGYDKDVILTPNTSYMEKFCS